MLDYVVERKTLDDLAQSVISSQCDFSIHFVLFPILHHTASRIRSSDCTNALSRAFSFLWKETSRHLWEFPQRPERWARSN